jgi:MarR family 2-MHQ and catechol resistance regulon transcriptional repressor
MRVGELYRLGRRLAEIAATAMGEPSASDLSAAERIIVQDLVENGLSTISDLASRTGFAQSRVSTVVAALRERGLVRTAVSEVDRRRTEVEPLEATRRLAAEARKSAGPALSVALAQLDPERRREVIAALDDLHRALLGGVPPTSGRPRAARPGDGAGGAVAVNARRRGGRGI